MDDKQKNLLPTSSPSQLLSVDEELWKMAEQRAQEILWTIEPSVLSEVNRKDVIDYVQRLIGDYYGVLVLPFGSVPLKTYLPDGDIDLTALSHENEEEDLAQAVCHLLKSENDPEYQVKDIEIIRAQVQLVKCTVKNIPVDISFNQMAGLYTIFFLEQVDQLVGKNHTFKRSVILVKAWCYYESRLLGAPHGLLSTYAIEILVLYIINRFHSSVRGPLEVLYIFLDYYGSFDWDHNYISIWGPKALSSLPEIVDTPESEFLLQKEFLENYRDMCSSKAKASETMTNEFPTKYMNILDPLRNDNNLGRSVTIANLHRIKFAFSYGAQRLEQILTITGENMGAALDKFFLCTLDRNGKGERADVDVPVSPFGTGRSEESVISGNCDSYYGGSQYAQLYPNYAMPRTTVHPNSPSSLSQDDILSLSTQKNWTKGDFLALSTQQIRSMFYQSGSDVCIPGQTPFHPTYSLKEEGRSRGTGTYIPDSNHNCYWHIRAKGNRLRRFPSAKYNALAKSSPQKEQVEEVHSEADVKDNSRPFELSNEDFPLLPGIRKATPPTQLGKVHSETDKDGNSRLSELSKEEFPHPPCVHKDTLPTQAKESAPLEKGLSKTDMDGNSRPFELSNEDFPLLPKVSSETRMDGNSRPFKLSNEDFPLLPKVSSETRMDGNSRPFKLSNEDFPLLPKVSSKTRMDGNSKSFELSKKDFPLLQRTHKATPSESAKLTKQAKSSPSSKESKVKNMKFRTLKYSQSLAKQSLSTKGDKEESGVSLSQETVLVVPKVALERKWESPESNEKMN